MSITLRNCVSTLLRKNSHELFKWSCRLAKLKLKLYSVTINEICCKRSIMERIKPVPALYTFVIIRIHPSKTFAVRLSYSCCQICLFLFCFCVKFFIIVSSSPALNTELDFVYVFFYNFVVFKFI